MIYLDNISYLFLSIEFAHERSQIGTVQSVGYIEVRSPTEDHRMGGGSGVVSVPGETDGLCPGGAYAQCGALSRRVSVRGISIQGGLCPGGSLSRGISVQGVSIWDILLECILVWRKFDIR